MSTLDQIPVVTDAQDSDYVVLKRGTKQHQRTLANFLDGVSGYSIEQVTASANYTLTASEANEVWVFIDGDSYELTLGAGTEGVKYVVFNTAAAEGNGVTINIGSGVTCPLINDGTSFIEDNTAGLAYKSATFYATSSSSYVAEGDISLPF